MGRPQPDGCRGDRHGWARMRVHQSRGWGPEVGPAGRAHCSRLLDHDLPEALQQLAPDVIVMRATLPDVVHHVFEPSVGALTPVDPDFVQQARLDYLAVTNLILSSSSAHVVFIKPPLINPYWMDLDSESRDPVVHAVLEGVMGEVVAAYPGCVRSCSTCGRGSRTTGSTKPPPSRPDGIHFGPDGALDVATQWLGPELVIEATRTASG